MNVWLQAGPAILERQRLHPAKFFWFWDFSVFLAWWSPLTMAGKISRVILMDGETALALTWTSRPSPFPRTHALRYATAAATSAYAPRTRRRFGFRAKKMTKGGKRAKLRSLLIGLELKSGTIAKA